MPLHVPKNSIGYDTDFRNPFKNVNYIYEYEFALNQDIQGGKRQPFWKAYWSPVQNWAGKCCLICLFLSLQGIKK